jgi:hypothetical protein
VAFSLFRKDTSDAAQRERADRLERSIADGFRRLSQLFTKAAELIESRRLERNGYVKPEKFLERAVRRRP